MLPLSLLFEGTICGMLSLAYQALNELNLYPTNVPIWEHGLFQLVHFHSE